MWNIDSIVKYALKALICPQFWILLWRNVIILFWVTSQKIKVIETVRKKCLWWPSSKSLKCACGWSSGKMNFSLCMTLTVNRKLIPCEELSDAVTLSILLESNKSTEFNVSWFLLSVWSNMSFWVKQLWSAFCTYYSLLWIVKLFWDIHERGEVSTILLINQENGASSIFARMVNVCCLS